MKTSARNVFKGKVKAIRSGVVNAEVDIDLGGDTLVAVVTTASVESLGLAPGKEVMAFVKAPWVTLLTEASDFRLSARNRLAGSVKMLEMGAVNAEVVLSLPGGAEVAAIVTKEAVADLGIAPGTPATALIKASHVILGVPA